MAVINLTTAGRVEVGSLSVQQHTMRANTDLAAGTPVRIVPSGAGAGSVTAAAGGTAGNAKAFGITSRAVKEGDAVTVIRRGPMDGWNLDALNYGVDVFLSDTAGRLDTAAGTVPTRLGFVMPVDGNRIGTAPDKILYVECTG